MRQDEATTTEETAVRPYTAFITYNGSHEALYTEGNCPYNAKLRAAKEFLTLHPAERPHDDQRRPYNIEVRAYFLVANNFVHLKVIDDRRIRE